MIPVTDEAMQTIRAKQVRRSLFANRTAKPSNRVSIRLNLNYKVTGTDGERYSIQTIHNSEFPRGRVLGYDSAATVVGADFIVDQQARAQIATGRHKFPMAGVVGFLHQVPPSLDGVEIRFNPKTSHLFTRVDDGRAVKSADEVTVFHNRAYARGRITYWDTESAPQALEGITSDAQF